MTTFRCLVFATTTLFFGSACGASHVADESRDERSTAQGIIGGTASAGDPAVGVLVAAKGSDVWLCTVSLIEPDAVLTAAHCVEGTTPNSTRLRVAFSQDLQTVQAADVYEVVEWHVDPDYDSQRLWLGHDAAVLRLSRPHAAEPLVLNRQPLSRSLVGRDVRVVGYGNDDGDAGTGSGLKRQLAAKLEGVESQTIRVGELGRTSCQGDSGGPTLLRMGQAEVIVGITSYGPKGCTGAASQSRVDAVSPWLDGLLSPVAQGEGNCVGGQESEPNNQRTAAGKLCERGRVRGWLGRNDTDWFTWTVPAGRSYGVHLSERTQPVTMTLYKWTAFGIVEIGGPDEEPQDDEATLSIERETDSGGRYFVELKRDGSSSTSYVLERVVE